MTQTMIQDKAGAGRPGEDTLENERLADLVQQGTGLLQDGDLEGAIARFQEVVAAFPDRPEGHNNLGALYSSLGRLEEAETCFDRVLQLLPGNPNILYNRGLIRARRERFESARVDFEAVLAHNPADADAHNNLGVASYMQGQVDQARDHFNQALGSNPGHGNALVNLCDLEAEAGHPERSIGLCEGYLAHRTSPQVRRKLIQMHKAVCGINLQKACSEAEAALAAEPGNNRIRQELGELIRARDALATA